MPVDTGDSSLYCLSTTLTTSWLYRRSDRLTAADCRHVLESFAFDVLDRNGRLRGSIDAILPDSVTSPVPGPAERYEAGEAPMSKLSASVVDDADPLAIRRARRDNYLAWRRVLRSRDGVEIPYETPFPGICPQVFPVRVTEPGRFFPRRERCGVSNVTPWPRLSPIVIADSQYSTATRSAREVVLPVSQYVDPATIESVGKRLP
ncbi:hypothetical protein [Halosolutus halophilus]|uniref:hypothetical protein n=1 Tax=Halosolutus halophilus TaxID=1552990 RepID=UPI0022350AFF|nr:hypothetical protein [Halosolutus halophilus]